MHYHFRTGLILHFYRAFVIDAMISNCQFKKCRTGFSAFGVLRAFGGDERALRKMVFDVRVYDFAPML